MNTQLSVFISSKMVELREEREALYKLLPTLDYGDIKLHAWVFDEDAPASDQSIRKIYLEALKNSALYIGLFWNEYGKWTIDEFDRATEWGIERHIYVKAVNTDQRAKKLTRFLNKWGDVPTGITDKWFKTTEELCEAVKKTLEDWVKVYLSGPRGEVNAGLYKTAGEIVERPVTLIGRGDLMTQTRSLLDKNERVLLQGFSGAGKTALAAEIAAQYIPVLWQRAGRSGIDTLFEALAKPFDAQQAVAKESSEGKIRVMRSILAQSGVRLVVLDDVWNGQVLQAVIKAIPPNIPLVVTSRRRYGVSKIVEVPDLTPTYALDLLNYHADAEYQTDPKASELVAKLGHLAFAVRLAGITLKMQKIRPEDLLVRIETAPHEFTTPLEFAETGRETVAKLLQVSLNALDPDTRQAFFAFGAFWQPTLTEEMLSLYFSGLTVRETALSNLHDHGLAERIDKTDNTIAYYRIHDLSYAYARDQATDEARDKALEACLAYTEHHNDPSLTNFAALRPELDNFMGAAEWAFARERWTDVESFAQQLVGDLDQFLGVQAYYEHVILLLTHGFMAAVNRKDKISQYWHSSNTGYTYGLLGDIEKAIQWHQLQLQIARDLKNRDFEAAALGDLSLDHHQDGRVMLAIELLEQAIDIRRELDDLKGAATALHNLGNIHRDIGRFDLAIGYFSLAQEIFHKLGEKRFEVATLEALGATYVELGKFEQAVNYYRTALKVNQEIYDRDQEGSIFSALGGAYIFLYEFDNARVCLEKAFEIHTGTGKRIAEVEVLNNLGLMYEKQKNYSHALEYYEQARKVAIEIKLSDMIEFVDHNIEILRHKIAENTSFDSN